MKHNGTMKNRNTITDPGILLNHIECFYTTELGVERIKKNLKLEVEDVVAWCKQMTRRDDAVITRAGKNWYVSVQECCITVNASCYSIITAHKEKSVK